MRTYIFCLLLLCFLLYSACVCSQCSYDYSIIIGMVSGLPDGLTWWSCVSGAFIFWKCKKSIIRYISSAKQKDAQEKKAQLQKQTEKANEELNRLEVLITQMSELKREHQQQKEEFKLIRYIFSAKQKDAQEKKALLQKQTKKANEELDGLEKLITQMSELKREHQQQKEEFKLLEEINQELAENKEKVHSVENELSKSEKEKEIDKAERYSEEKQSLLTAQRKLEKRKKELESLHLSMKKQLQQTEDIIKRMMERKTKVERYLEVFNLQLEEVESQSDMAHLYTE